MTSGMLLTVTFLHSLFLVLCFLFTPIVATVGTGKVGLFFLATIATGD